MAKLNDCELQERLITISENISGRKVGLNSKFSDDLEFDSMDFNDLCIAIEVLGFDFDKVLNYCMANRNITVSELATYLVSLKK